MLSADHTVDKPQAAWRIARQLLAETAALNDTPSGPRETDGMNIIGVQESRPIPMRREIRF